MEANGLFHDRYFLERLLGRGNFSEVWLAKDTKTDIYVALKIYAPATGLDDAGLNVFAREFALVVNANHKNLLKPLYYDSCDRKPYLVLPYCKDGSILKMVGKFSEHDAWRLIRDVASGLAWLHGMNPPVIHQDIKPDNVMVGDNGDFMITDFGVSTHLRSALRKSLSSAFTSAGTIAYMAPERFGKENTPIMANDIYSLGVMAFEMLSGDTPFGDNGGLIQKKGAEIPELSGNYSDQLKKVIRKCLSADPWNRPTAEQLEEYANTGLSGGIIKFADEQSVWEKHRKLFILLFFVLAVAGAVCGYFYKVNADRKAELAKEIKIKCHNDSLLLVISKLSSTGDSLVVAGDLHDEGYDDAYLNAYNDYKKAFANLNLMLPAPGDSVLVKDDSGLTSKIQELDRKLYDAFVIFNEKAELFSDDPEIEGDFKARMLKISQIVNIDSVKNVVAKEMEAASQTTDNQIINN